MTLKIYKSAEIKKFDKRPGLIGTFAHGTSLSLAHWLLAKDAVLAPHTHRHEQITYVISGKMRFEGKDGNPKIVEGGSFIVFAPDELHGGVALENSVALDAFSPAREDFKAEMGWIEKE
ncbi:MAG: cupin domain-containing protein [Synergistaceae bacterium]|jgi:quercetin dioxygenase-like cupin family protein|nr:cupin domain-containing protein [Synergistaceae bacterium]